MSLTLQFAFVLLVVWAASKALGAAVKRIASRKLRSNHVEATASPAYTPPISEKHSVVHQRSPQHDAMEDNKHLYHKLQNLEQHPEVLPQSWDLLASLLSETIAEALRTPTAGILSIRQHSGDALKEFLQGEHNRISQQWEAYISRRRAGQPREMFRDAEEAKWWLKQAAPVKYVDGAWVGHINKVTTPFALRHVTKNAWQVMSEELGDGDEPKNHVSVYRDLMKQIDPNLPQGDVADFIHPRHELNEPRVWKAAVAQLLISLFPHDFLPEILGFNMAYEATPLHLLVTAKELEELKINAYYFTLHISIDNGDSGHAAMAAEAVIDYIDYIRKTNGTTAAEQAWKRVQAGYLLADGLPTTPESPSTKARAEAACAPNGAEAAVSKIFEAKAQVAHKIHCNSRLRIGRHSLVEWLEPSAFKDKDRQMKFLNELSNCKPWVLKGDSAKSRLVRELGWEGRMFGSFTQTEVDVVREWIDSLRWGVVDPSLYWNFTGRPRITSEDRFGREQDILRDYPVLDDCELPAQYGVDQGVLYFTPLRPDLSRLTLHSQTSVPMKLDIETLYMPRIMPIWFAHPCLLQQFVNVPAKVANRTGSAVVRLLRAQSGFAVEGPGVAGMDEVRRTDVVGLLELGVEMLCNNALGEPTDLASVFRMTGSCAAHNSGGAVAFAKTMLRLSMRPMGNRSLLFGLAWAFVDLHELMTTSDRLSASGRAALRDIARRERESLQVCIEEIGAEGPEFEKFWRGYEIGRLEIEKCSYRFLGAY